jgi:cell division protein FtsW (lipid II flippase)
VGAYVAAHLFSQVHERVTYWLDPWPTAAKGYGGFQLAEGWYYMGTGGVGGLGIGTTTFLGAGGSRIPEITSDMIFAAIGGELGLLGTSSVVMAYTLMVGAGLRIAQTARSSFSRLLAVGLTTIIGFQSFFIMAGVLRLLPFTGITLPFIAYGGSSLIANYVLVAILLRVSNEGALTRQEELTGVVQPGERAFAAVDG